MGGPERVTALKMGPADDSRMSALFHRGGAVGPGAPLAVEDGAIVVPYLPHEVITILVD